MKKDCEKNCNLTLILAIAGAVTFITGLVILIIKLVNSKHDNLCNDDYCDENGCCCYADDLDGDDKKDESEGN